MKDFNTWCTIYRPYLTSMYDIFLIRFKDKLPKDKVESFDFFNYFCNIIYIQSNQHINKYDYEEFLQRRR